MEQFWRYARRKEIYTDRDTKPNFVPLCVKQSKFFKSEKFFLARKREHHASDKLVFVPM